MKKATVILALAAILTGCAATAEIPAREDRDLSWQAFCASRGYDPHAEDTDAYDEYLDTWCGSTEEEQAMAKANL